MDNNNFRIVVIGASAGGLNPLKTLFRGLPALLPAAVFVVLHTSPFGRSHLPEILNSVSDLSVKSASQEEKILQGHVYVAPPDHHLVIEDGSAETNNAPKENRNRPAINPLFRTAAQHYGARVIGVVLSGLLDDGTAGLYEIKKRGGITVVQSPADAEQSDMPSSAIINVEVDHVVPAAEMADLLTSLCRGKTYGPDTDDIHLPRLWREHRKAD